MSTVYYGYNTDEVYDRRTLLGQSAGGWEFLFRGNRAEGIIGIQTWLRQLDTFAFIQDEYSHELDIDDFLELVESWLPMVDGDDKLIRRDDARFRHYHPNLSKQQWRDQGCFFADYEFR